jgi:transcriptional regulator
MYAIPACRMDRSACLAFAAARGFGVVAALDGARPVASALPFHIAYGDDGTPRVELHMARKNPLALRAAHRAPFLIAVLGADAYVSPDWYVSPDQVPTWLYETVNLAGRARLLPAERTCEHLELLSRTFEVRLAKKPPWTMSGLTPARREAMLNAIVAIEIEVEVVEGSAKLNQHKSDADHLAVASRLAAADPMSRSVAARMVALRPELSYEVPIEDLAHG